MEMPACEEECVRISCKHYGKKRMSAMKEFKPMKEGKVREIYDNGDSLIMVATDRISAFDVILKNKITDKTTREQPGLYSTRCSPSSKFLVSSTIYTGRSFSSVKSMAIYSPMIPMRKNIMANIKQISTTMVA